MLFFLTLLSFCSALGFSGHFLVSEDAVAVQDFDISSKVLNGNNYPSRIVVELANLNDYTSSIAPVNTQYKFEFHNLEKGNYSLLVASHDFNFQKDLFKVVVEDNITIYDDDLKFRHHNASGLLVSYREPLVIKATGTKDYYEHALGSMKDILMNSPLGPIFQNRLYTIVFIATVAMMVAPYVLLYISPDLAETMNEIRNQGQVPKQPAPVQVQAKSQSQAQTQGPKAVRRRKK